MNVVFSRSGERARKWASPKPDTVVAALWLILGLCGWFLMGPIWIAAMQPAPNQIIDSYQDWGSARNFWVGLPVYTPHSTSIPRHLGLPSTPNLSIIEYNVHPPTSVLLALPLARFDYPDAVLVWNTISLAAFLVSLLIVAAVLPLPRTLSVPALASLPFCHPLYENVFQGQLNLVLLLLLTAIWVLERSGRSSAAALLLGAAAAIKLYPAFLAIYYVAQGRIRPLIFAALSFLALTFVTTLILGPDAFHDYATVVLPWNQDFRILGYNISIAGLWHKLFHPIQGEMIEPLWPSLAVARWATLLSNLAITAMVATVVHRARTLTERDLAFASTVTAMLLVSPVTWDTSLLLLLVPIAVIARSAQKSRWIPAALPLILAIDWIPQHLLTELAQAGRSFTVVPWTFMLGAPSLKFYALLGTLVLVLAAFRVEKENEEPISLTAALEIESSSKKSPISWKNVRGSPV
jgi:alpha-1,2-mannosyltransferase